MRRCCLRHPPCPQCPYSRDLRRLAELLALRQEVVNRRDTDRMIEIDAEIQSMGLPPPANDNEPETGDSFS
jgi:hypothetical protein